MILLTRQAKPVELGAEVGHGGEAVVYRVAGEPNRLAKIFHSQPRPDYPRKLDWMVTHPPKNPTASLNHASLAWPDLLLYDSTGSLKGFCMPYISHAVPLLEVFNPRRRAVVLPQFDRRYLHRTARNLAAALGALHNGGYVVGDLNESNVLVTPSALVTLIDTDSFQVVEKHGRTEYLHHCPVAKLEYTPPELQGKPLSTIRRVPDHDAFSLAVLIFQLLMDGSHPFRAQWLGQGDPPPLEKRIANGDFPYAPYRSIPILPPANLLGLEMLHPWLGELFQRCFIDGHRSPRWRPGPSLWTRAIEEAERKLVCCAKGHYYSSHLTFCPYCVPVPRQTVVASGLTGLDSQSVLIRMRYRQKQTVPADAQASGSALSPPAAVAPAMSFTPASLMWNRIKGVLASLGNQPYFNPQVFREWYRRLIKPSLTIGAGQGAAGGAIPGALVAYACWSTGNALTWDLLFGLGGAVGGLIRGWFPGQRLAALVGQTIGWRRFWAWCGAAGAAIIGGYLGTLVEWKTVPVLMGAVVGAMIGYPLGTKLWQTGATLGWEKIWKWINMVAVAAIGWGMAAAVAATGLNRFGVQLSAGLEPYSGDHHFSSALLWLAAGGFSGALAGAIAGFFIDFFARLSRLNR